MACLKTGPAPDCSNFHPEQSLRWVDLNIRIIFNTGLSQLSSAYTPIPGGKLIFL